MRRAIFLLVLGAVVLLGAALPARSQEAPSGSTDVAVDDVRPLVTDTTLPRQVETYLAVDPTDPENMIATALADTEDGALVYTTRDGGSGWTLVEDAPGSVFPGGDPMVAFGGDGRAYLSTLASGFSVWRSDDGGQSWGDPAEVEGTFDRQWVTASGSPDGDGPVFAAARAGQQPESAVAVYVSRDGGRTFTESLRRVPEEILNTVRDLEITRDGAVLVPYLVFFRPDERGQERVAGERRILLSRDGGETWEGPHRMGEQSVFTNAADEDLMYKGLAAGGVAADESGGPHDGTVYSTWIHVMDGHLQVVLARSRDGGRSWSDPVRVNREGDRSHHSTPQVAVGADGTVAVTWNDRRHDPADQCYHHYVAVSRDGGRTFDSERRVSERETCFPSGYRWQNGGETQGLVALPEGGFRVVWTGPGPDAPRPWTARIRVD